MKAFSKFSTKCGAGVDPDPLYVTCRTCGKPVPSGFRLTSAVYEIPAGTRHDLTCPHCGTGASYTKADFHILSEANS